MGWKRKRSSPKLSVRVVVSARQKAVKQNEGFPTPENETKLTEKWCQVWRWNSASMSGVFFQLLSRHSQAQTLVFAGRKQEKKVDKYLVHSRSWWEFDSDLWQQKLRSFSCLLTVYDIPNVDNVFDDLHNSITFCILATFFEFEDGVC